LPEILVGSSSFWLLLKYVLECRSFIVVFKSFSSCARILSNLKPIGIGWYPRVQRLRPAQECLRKWLFTYLGIPRHSEVSAKVSILSRKFPLFNSAEFSIVYFCGIVHCKSAEFHVILQNSVFFVYGIPYTESQWYNDESYKKLKILL
jgi:hypothetical protein